MLTIIFFLVGQFEVKNFYRFTLYSVKRLSIVPLSFYGKFSFGYSDERFSVIIASIPLTVFLMSKILKLKRHSLLISILTFTIYFICSYAFVCLYTGLSYHVSNDFYHGEKIEKSFTAINLNKIFLITIISTASLTSLSFFIQKFVWLINLKKSKK